MTRPRQQEHGFALISVLAAIAFTSLIIGALLGLVLTTMRVTAAQERGARELRAADGAIETAVNRLRSEQCATTTPFVDDLVFDQDTTTGDDDVVVDVGCTDVVTPGSDTDQVRLVGLDGYQGDVRFTEDCAAAPAAVGCFPWVAAWGSVPSGLVASRATLLHSGPEPLRFTTGVRVKTGAIALRSAAGDSPAIDVGGTYLQGSRGLLAPPTGAPACGALEGTGNGGPAKVRDVDGIPECEVQIARLTDGEPTEAQSGLVPSTEPFTIPTCTASDPVVNFTRGTYGVAQTAQVSALLDGSRAACRGKTFWFEPGVYKFSGTNLTFDDPTAYYVFGAPGTWNPTLGVSADPASAGVPDPPLCDRQVSGTSLVISSQTELRHRSGRLAICPVIRPGSTESDTAIYQETSKPTAVTVTTPLPLSRTFSCRLPYFNLLGHRYPTHWDIDNEYDGACRPIRNYTVATTTEGIAPLSSLRVMITGSEDQLYTPNNLLSKRSTRITVVSSTGSQICQTAFVRGVPNGGLTSSFDLLTMPGGSSACAGRLTNQSQLQGATLRIEHRMELAWSVLLPNITQRLDITKVEIEVNPATGTPATATTPGQWNQVADAASPDAAAASPVMPCSTLVCSVADPGRQISPGDRGDRFTHEMTLSDFSFSGLPDFSASGLDPSVMTLRALVRVVPSAASMPPGWETFLQPDNFIPEMYTYLELRTPEGARCVTQGSGMNSDQEIAFDLLDINLLDRGPVGCTDFLVEQASQLDDVEVTLRFELPCVRDWLHDVPWECYRSLFYDPDDTAPVWRVRPPDVSSVRLTMVTDSYAGPPATSNLTIDATPGARGSSVNVHGRVWMPLSDIDVHWAGDATTAPLFGDDLVLHGLGSRTTLPAGRPFEMGVVCCSPPETRTVDLVASVDGQSRLRATVRLTDVVVDAFGNRVPSLGHRVEVQDWELCRTGCATVMGPAAGP